MHQEIIYEGIFILPDYERENDGRLDCLTLKIHHTGSKRPVLGNNWSSFAYPSDDFLYTIWTAIKPCTKNSMLNNISMVYRSWHDITQEKTMNDQTIETNETKTTDKVRNPRQRNEKSIRSLSLQEVDIALGGYEKTIRMNTESIKSKLSTGLTIPPDVLRDLAIANK